MSSRSTLNPELVERVRQLQADGASRRQACAAAGVAESTMRSWERYLERPISNADKLPERPSPTPAGEIPVIHRDYSHLEELYVYPLGDIHKGAPEHQGDLWREWLAYVESRREVSLMFTGDGLNSALKTSVSETYDEVMTVGAARRELTADLRSIREKIDVMIPGNHEARIYRAIGDCPIEIISEVLDVPYARASCMVVYKVGDITYEVYLRHGSGGGQIGAQANRLAKQANIVLADVYVSGHTHQQQAFPQDLFVRDGDRLVRRKQLFVASGSFLAYEDYAAAAGYTPTHIGAPRIRLDGTRHDAHASV